MASQRCQGRDSAGSPAGSRASTRPRASCRGTVGARSDRDIDHDEIDDNDEPFRTPALNIDQARGPDGFDIGDAGLRNRLLGDATRTCAESAPFARATPHSAARPASRPSRRAQPIEQHAGVPGLALLRRAPAADGPRSGPLRPGSVSPSRASTSGGISTSTPREPTVMSEPPSSGCQSTGPVIRWATRSSRIRSAAAGALRGLRPRTRALRETIGRLKSVTTAVSPEGSALTAAMAGAPAAALALARPGRPGAASPAEHTPARRLEGADRPLKAGSIDLRHEPASRQTRLVVVGVLLRTRRAASPSAGRASCAESASAGARCVEARALLVVGPDDVPGRDARVGRLEHRVARARVVVPLGARRQVHRAQLPLPQRIVDARLESPLLLLVADFEPELDQDDAALDDVLFELRAELEKALVLLLRCRSPSRARRRRGCTSCGRRSRFRRPPESAACSAACTSGSSRGRRAPGSATSAEHARADALGDRLDRAAFAGRVAPLEDDDDAQSLGLDPLLQDAELALQPRQLLLDTSCRLSFVIASPSSSRSLTAASRRRACGTAPPARAAPPHASAPAAAAARTGPDRRSGSRCSWRAPNRSARATGRTASCRAVTPVSPLHADFRQLLNRHQRVGHFAVPVERGLLVLGERRVEARLHRLEVPAEAPALEHRLQQPGADRPHAPVAAEKLRRDRR